MSKIGIRKFVELLQKSNLAPVDSLRTALNDYKTQTGQGLSDPEPVAQFLVQRGLITEWHGQKLLSGKYRGFYLGDYRLLGHLGTGGMSTVYLAEHVDTGEKRAIKVLPRSRVGKRSYLDRFLHEAKATARLNHPNIVKAFGVAQDAQTYFIIMEYVPGKDINGMVKAKGPLEIHAAARITAQAANALQYAHDQGIIHRDIKPGNLLVDPSGVVKILDLGLALSREAESSITQMYNERVLGTADYLAPEQALNSHQIDSRADIYSLGCSLYFMLAGHPPFPEGSLVQRITAHQTREPESIAKVRPDCPDELRRILEKMMRKQADERYTNCSEVFDELCRWLATEGEAVQGSGYVPMLKQQSEIPAPAPLDADAQLESLEIRREGDSSESALSSSDWVTSLSTASNSSGDLDKIPLEVRTDSSSVVARRLAQTDSRSQLRWRQWIGITFLFFVLLVALVLVIMWAI